MINAIISNMHHDQEALKNCCLVSKGWVPQSQKHLFKDKQITFRLVEDAVAWSEIFPDPTRPPASYARSLTLHCARSITNGYFSRNPNIVELEVSSCYDDPTHEPSSCCAPLGNLLPNVESLEMYWDRSVKAQEIFDLLCSFPHLKDLRVLGAGFESICFDGYVASRPSFPPPLTGTLTVSTLAPLNFLRLLAELPIDLRFRKIVKWYNFYSEEMAKVVERCSGTLESIDIQISRNCRTVNLSKATKLKEADFRIDIYNIPYFQQVVETLGTITGDHKDFERVTIHLTFSSGVCCDKEIFRGTFREIDNALVQLRERRSSPFCVKLVWDIPGAVRRHFDIQLENLLPRVMERRDIGLDLGDIGSDFGDIGPDLGDIGSDLGDIGFDWSYFYDGSGFEF